MKIIFGRCFVKCVQPHLERAEDSHHQNAEDGQSDQNLNQRETPGTSSFV